VELALDIISGTLLSIGTIFCIVAGVGINRFPDVYTRMHAAGLSDTLGVLFILTGLGLQAESWSVVIKLVFVVIFLWISGPTATHALAQSAYAHGIEPILPEGESTIIDSDGTEEPS